jgi:hypothetical protein
MRHENFKSLCRENTGGHMLDSGGHYGRHWQKDAIGEGEPVVTFPQDYALINTGVFLDKMMTIDKTIQEEFEAFAEADDQKEQAWEDTVNDFVKSKGWGVCTSGNTYNEENSLNQDFLYAVLAYNPDDVGDWVYLGEEESVVIIRTHNGCDARGGFSMPLFCHSTNDEYVMPFDITAGFRVQDCRDSKGNDIDDGYELYQEIEVGYSNSPESELKKLVERWFEFTRNESEGSVCVKMNDGNICKIYADVRTDW